MRYQLNGSIGLILFVREFEIPVADGQSEEVTNSLAIKKAEKIAEKLHREHPKVVIKAELRPAKTIWSTEVS